MKYRSVFSYYGGKSRLAPLYPAPTHDMIIEPFAGGAAYSLLYHERDVLINDFDYKTFMMWAFMQHPNAGDLIETLVPNTVERGARVADMLPADAPKGLLWILQAAANQGTQGHRGARDVITPWGVRDWHRVKPRLLYWLPRIAHWRIHNGNYDTIAPWRATWFIDPPYNNAAGRCYRAGADGINFDALATWCRSQHGQIIVCENDGADWLPFQQLSAGRGLTKRVGAEVIWTNDR